MKRQHLYALLLGNGLFTAAALTVLVGGAVATPAVSATPSSSLSVSAPVQRQWSHAPMGHVLPVARTVSSEASQRPALPTWVF
jgi:hypothetical protein